MTIVFDAATATDGFGPTVNFSHTVGVAGADRLFVACISTDSTPTPGHTVSVCTYGGVALTYAAEITNAESDGIGNIATQIWYLRNPPTGANNLIVTVGATVSLLKVTALSYYGVVGGPEASASDCGFFNVTVTSTNLVTITDNALIVTSMAGANAGAGPVAPDVNQTERSELLDNFRSAASADRIVTDAGTYSLSWTNPSEWGTVTMLAVAFPSELLDGNAIFFGMPF